MGRDDALLSLHQKLQEKERVAICAIAGMGGIGKTELALQYSLYHQKQKTYPGGICWLQAGGVDVGIDIVKFARTKLDLQPPDGELQDQVSYCWGHWREGEVLVVLDDVRDYQQIEPYLPPAELRFKVLITSRRQWLGEFEQLNLEVLSAEESLELLVSFVGEKRIQQEINEAQQLCGDLGYLPLGLELVGRYLKRKQDLPLAQMRQRLRLEHRSLEKRSPDMTAKRGVAAAFELSWQELDESAQELGCLLSIFALAPIPWGLVEQCLPEQDEEDLEDLRDESLLGWSLLERSGEGSYQLHQLIREFFRSKLEQLVEAKELKRRFCQVMVVEAQKIPHTPTQRDIAQTAPIIPHLAEAATVHKNWLSNEDLITPFVGLGRFHEGQGSYLPAVEWYEKCCLETKTRLGDENPYMAASLNNLALLYCSQGRYDEAEPFYLQALKLWKKLFGNEHTSVATSFNNNLAGLYELQGRYEEAEPLYQQALELRKKLLGNEHPDVATSINNLAALYDSQGRYDKAEPLYLQTLELDKKLLGNEHPHMATSINNLAGLYDSQGRYDKAEPLYLQALALKKKLFGNEHPSVATSINNLAALYDSQERYDKAEPLYLQALALRKKLLGNEHPHVAASINNLAAIYDSQRRYNEAEHLYLQALELRKKLLGNEHPDVATSINNLAFLYKLQGRYDKAEPLYLQALALDKKLLGDEHPSVATSINNLAALYYSQGRYDKAEPLFIQALALRKKLLGDEHPHTKITRKNLEYLRDNKKQTIAFLIRMMYKVLCFWKWGTGNSQKIDN
ncbi:MAG: tetratricopeptide repeat protein [Symploca sp. SIO2G7]|nr:tetratricopeptide repeat protein [Symploca sp. SIO2G7]